MVIDLVPLKCSVRRVNTVDCEPFMSICFEGGPKSGAAMAASVTPMALALAGVREADTSVRTTSTETDTQTRQLPVVEISLLR